MVFPCLRRSERATLTVWVVMLPHWRVEQPPKRARYHVVQTSEQARDDGRRHVLLVCVDLRGLGIVDES